MKFKIGDKAKSVRAMYDANNNLTGVVTKIKRDGLDVVINLDEASAEKSGRTFIQLEASKFDLIEEESAFKAGDRVKTTDNTRFWKPNKTGTIVKHTEAWSRFVPVGEIAVRFDDEKYSNSTEDGGFHPVVINNLEFVSKPVDKHVDKETLKSIRKDLRHMEDDIVELLSR